jgi:hypothetical protein
MVLPKLILNFFLKQSSLKIEKDPELAIKLKWMAMKGRCDEEANQSVG